VGASGWSYVVTYEGDPAAELAALRETAFAEDDLFWYDDDDPRGPKPATLAELDSLRETEEYWEVGAHSILDMDRIIASGDEDHDGTVRQLPESEAQELFGTTTPTREQFEQVEERIPDIRRWSGRYQLLYSDDKPTEIAFWGFSGD
jgi:hypothetical protein